MRNRSQDPENQSATLAATLGLSSFLSLCMSLCLSHVFLFLFPTWRQAALVFFCKGKWKPEFAYSGGSADSSI